MHTAFRIDTGGVEVLAGIQAHQIRGGGIAAAPVLDDGMSAGELHQRFIGRAQGRFGFEQPHVTTHGALAHASDHGRNAAGSQIGAGGEHRCIHGQQFLSIFGFSAEQLPAEMHSGVELEQHGGKLNPANLSIKTYLDQIQAIGFALGFISAKENVPSADPNRLVGYRSLKPCESRAQSCLDFVGIHLRAGR